MAKIQRFEDIEAWKSARQLVKSIYGLTGNSKFRRDFGLRDQIQRSAVSTMSNIAEGFESQSDRHFISYLFRARGSVGEVRSQLYVALDQGYITREEFDATVVKTLQTIRLIAGFIGYLQLGKRGLKRSARL